ncbi:MAG: nucleotidyltransferase domain-containing protein [Candidatus Margulisbacteria bacterium]|nr:nucleotidyltransferase domain-containing protein [Candidatus Margulisiibacteriota bacterium]
MIAVSEDEKRLIQDILRRHVPQAEVRVFGSRQKGGHKNHSDLDLALVGDFDDGSLSALRCEFEESRLPYRVDVLDYRALSTEFRQIVDTEYTLFPL